jgi:hypothetical protein
MRTLSSTLLAAQKQATRTPYLKVEIRQRLGAATRLDFQRIYTGSEPDYYHASTSPGDGSLIRARISTGTPNNLYRQRVTNPGPGSDFSQWTLIEAVGWTAGTALCSQGANVLHFWVGTDFKTIKYQESSDYGISWGSIHNLFVTQNAIYHMAAAMKPNGDVALFFWEVNTIKVILRTAGVWSAYSGLREYYASGDDTGDGAIYGNNWQAQTFTTQDAYRITSVRLKLYRSGNPGTVTVSIRATDASGHPTGSDLCSGTTDGNTLTIDTAGEERDISFGAGYPLAISTRYAIVVRAAGSGIVIFEYYNTGDDGYDYASGAHWHAQTFTPQQAHTITKVKLKLFREGNPTGGHMALRATDASGHPTGANLAVCDFDPATISTNPAGQWYEFTFSSPYALTQGTKYAILLYTDTGSASDRLGWRKDGSSPTYANGNSEHSANSGTSWTSYPASDMMFEEWGYTTTDALYWREDATSPTYAGGYVEISSNGGSSWTGYSGRDKWFRIYGWEPWDWTNALSVCSGIAVAYLNDWNLAVSGRDAGDKRGVWSCIYGDGGSAPVNTWTALKEILLAEIDSNTDYKYPKLAYDGTIHRLTFLEVFAATETYSRPYLSFLLPGSLFLDNLWREPYPFNLSSDYGLAIVCSSNFAFLTTPYGVWQATLNPTPLNLTPDVLSLKQHIHPVGQVEASSQGKEAVPPGSLTLELRNDQGQYANFDKKGCEVLVSPGYRTTAGDESSSGPSFWVEAFEHISLPRSHVPGSTLILYATDAWGLLEGWRARRQLTWAINTSTVKEILIYLLSRVGIPLTVQSQSTLITTFKPAFTVHPGESGAAALKRLLVMVPDVLFFREATAYLKHHQTSDTTDYSYFLAPGSNQHPLQEGRYWQETMNTNRVQVWGTQTPHIMVDRFNWDDLEDVYDRLHQVRDLNINTVSLAEQRANALLREAQIASKDGEASVPMNCGQELWDVIEITDPRANLQAQKYRVRSLEIQFSTAKPEYQLKVILGAL